MGRIICLMGKSSSGKDTIYKMLLTQKEIPLKPMIPYTTRPIRSGETDGVEYRFLTEDGLDLLIEQKRVVELRQYQTIYGIWKYFTVDDGQIDLSDDDYLMIGTLEAYQKIRTHYGKERVLPIYIEVDDGLRLQRALDRERAQDTPKYTELCRRFLADAEDFSEEKIAEAGIEKRFCNVDLNGTVSEITSYLKDNSQKNQAKKG